jgi:hypothetical protein
MNITRRVPRAVCWLAASVGLAFSVAHGRAASDFPAASNVIHHVIQRAQQVAESGEEARYTYDKRALLEELDADGRVTKSIEKLYKVVLIGGLPFPKLVKVQGRDLSPAELEKQNKREEKFRQKITQVDVKEKARKKEAWISKELVDKFDFTVTKRESVEGRPTLVLVFVPTAAVTSSKSMEDKVLGRVVGTIWIDEQDFEIAKVETKLRGSLSLGWLGMIGSLSKFDMTLIRQRMPDGAWVNVKQTMWVVARKLFESIRFKNLEESSGFAKE